MKRPVSPLSLSLALLFTLCASSGIQAAGYKSAEFTRLQNEVKILKENEAPSDASVGQEIGAVTSVATGAGSRAELRFPDKSLTRLGANSRFTLRGDQRTLDLDQGVMLLQVPKQMGGAKVRTAAVTAAVTGTTVMFEYLPGGYVKLIVIEGSVDLYYNDNPGKFKSIQAGQMIIMQVDSRNIPEPVDIDLERLLKTSNLINGDEINLPNSKEVSQAIQQQKKEIEKGKLVETTLVIPGRGTMVHLETDSHVNLFNNVGINNGTQNTSGNPPPGDNQNTPQGNNNPPDDNTPPPSQDNPPVNEPNQPNHPNQGQVPLIPGTSTMGSDSLIETNPHITVYNSITNESTRFEGRTYNGLGLFSTFAFNKNVTPANPNFQPYLQANGPWATFKFENLVINGTPDFSFPGANPTTSIILASIGNITLEPMPDLEIPYGTLDIVPSYHWDDSEDIIWDEENYVTDLVLYSQTGNIILHQNFAIYAGSYDLPGVYQNVSLVAAGPNSNVTIQGSIGIANGDLLISAGNNITIEGTPPVPDVTSGTFVSATNIDARAGNNIHLNKAQINAPNRISLTAKNQISVTSSSELIAYADMYVAGKILLTSTDGGIDVGDNLGETTLNASSDYCTDESVIQIDAKTYVNLVNVNSSSDVFKATTISPNGVINIGGGKIEAGSLIQIYAGSAGELNFIANTELKGRDINLAAGKHIKIDGGVLVTVPGGGATKVFAPQNGRLYNIQGVTPIVPNTYGNFSNPVVEGEYHTKPSYSPPPSGSH